VLGGRAEQNSKVGGGPSELGYRWARELVFKLYETTEVFLKSDSGKTQNIFKAKLL
jgi:hypothetical protein